MKRFTLIELLVVIGIICVVASMLMPTLNGARGRAKTMYCLNNQKHIGGADAQYQNDYNYLVPTAYTMAGNITFWAGSRNSAMYNDYTQDGYLATYLKSAKSSQGERGAAALIGSNIFFCTAPLITNIMEANNFTVNSSMMSGYGINTAIHGYENNSSFPMTRPESLNKRMVSLGCAVSGYMGIRITDVISSRYSYMISASSTAFIHHGRANVLYTDGSAISEEPGYICDDSFSLEHNIGGVGADSVSDIGMYIKDNHPMYSYYAMFF